MRQIIVTLAFLLIAQSAQANVVAEALEYRHGDIVLEGYLAYDDSISGKRPGVLVVHEWTGLNDYTKSRTKQLAELGYIAFAVDMYGKGVRPQNVEEAAAQAKIYRSDRRLMRERVAAGLDVLMRQQFCDSSRVAAIGYCFGGGTVLELARSGADISGVVSFHGNLDTPQPQDARNIKAKVLVLHGAADPHVPQEQLTGFREEMHSAGVDWYLIAYGGAVHSFTNPDSGGDPSRGVAYDAAADRRSWQAMQIFFDELFH